MLRSTGIWNLTRRHEEKKNAGIRVLEIQWLWESGDVLLVYTTVALVKGFIG
jgi:hypothetical protein